LILTAGSGGIGASLHYIRLSANTLSAVTTGFYGFVEADTVTISAGGLNGSVGNHLAGGTFVLGGPDRLDDNDLVIVDAGILKLNGFNESLRAIASLSGSSIVNGSATHSTLTLTDNGGFFLLAGTLGGVTADENNFSINKTGSSSTTISGNNAFSGSFVTGPGRVTVSHPNALGATAGSTTVSAGGALEFNGISLAAEPIFVSGSGNGTKAALNNDSATAASHSGSITLLGNATAGGTGNLTFGGVIDDETSTFGLTKSGCNG
jgi:hypothetical protein